MWLSGHRRARARFPLNFLEEVTYGLFAFRGGIVEVDFGPASEILLENRIRQRIQFGREWRFWRFVPEIWHKHSPTDTHTILHIKCATESVNRTCGKV